GLTALHTPPAPSLATSSRLPSVVFVANATLLINPPGLIFARSGQTLALTAVCLAYHTCPAVSTETSPMWPSPPREALTDTILIPTGSGIGVNGVQLAPATWLLKNSWPF